jgi:8-oxo-dGTP pyrophosphatase MutT (NUDIX family)
MKKSIRAGSFILNNKNQIALANEHLWGFPRGGVEEGEEIIEAAKKEALEEVGIPSEELEYIEKIGIYDRYPNGIDSNTPGAFPMEIHIFLFKTSYEKDLVPTDSNVKEARWVDLKDVSELLTDSKDREFFESWYNKKDIERE